VAVLAGVGIGSYHPLVPLEVVRDERRRWIVVRATGCVTLGEVLQLIQTARADLEYRMWPMLFDAQSSTTDATERDVEDAVDVVRRAVETQGRRGHVALLSGDDVFYARMLLYEARCADVGVRVIRAFRQRNDAERWLEIVSAARHFR
jgi:hypothetical protein